MQSILFTYPWDVLDAGLDVALGEIAELGRQQGISLATSYHHGRFGRPHIPGAVRARAAARPVARSAYAGSAPAVGWSDGLQLDALLEIPALETVLLWMYGMDPLEAARAYAAGGRVVSGRARIGAMLSGIAPDAVSSHQVVPTVRALADLGVERVNMYNYGLMRRPTLAAIGKALGELTTP